MTDTTNDSNPTMDSVRHYGVVKWFDKMKGFGFLQQLHTKNDYFVHYTQLLSDDDAESKYLVAGEYVEFSITASTTNKSIAANDIDGTTEHTSSKIAANVTGIMGGPLLYRSQQRQRTYHRRDHSFVRSSHRTPHYHHKPTATTQPPTAQTHMAQTNRFDALHAE